MKHIAIREASILGGCLVFGFLVLPALVFFVGQNVFGGYGGDGYGGFFSALASRVFTFNGSAWFLILSPYLALQIVRLVITGWRKTAAM